jgi:hypothetical protein
MICGWQSAKRLSKRAKAVFALITAGNLYGGTRGVLDVQVATLRHF